MSKPGITLSSQDLARLESLLENQPGSSVLIVQLEDELARANVVAPNEVPANVVSMNSLVKFKVLPGNETFERKLVYPHDLAQHADAVSILTPIGSALLGMEEGQTIDWPQPNGQTMQVIIEKVLYQPEREGEYN
ncbi:nucleoside diphosphate kinase regulator [Alkanindiges sp. WGS2144]|uniref:nucleoside diphosphate kinase regulator n=1 Tax=Alkanindiges sp. WGS2144 TaxID=3366808 RepID=UPI003752F202